ncbi:MAG: hypothetical protein M1834_005995 [Cirrosporium novae-zelandiae]|nr:MAG: hypothetical protein M1834_005995 [Cirrosporium novae-zelandiae]
MQFSIFMIYILVAIGLLTTATTKGSRHSTKTVSHSTETTSHLTMMKVISTATSDTASFKTTSHLTTMKDISTAISDTALPETTGKSTEALNLNDYPDLGEPQCMAKSRMSHWQWECQWRLRSFSWRQYLQQILDKINDDAYYTEHESIWCRTLLNDMSTCNDIRIKFHMLCISLQDTPRTISGKIIKEAVKLTVNKGCHTCAEVPLQGGGYLSFDFND